MVINIPCSGTLQPSPRTTTIPMMEVEVVDYGDYYKGLALALTSCVFIGTSFIVKKKGLRKVAQSSNARAGKHIRNMIIMDSTEWFPVAASHWALRKSSFLLALRMCTSTPWCGALTVQSHNPVRISPSPYDLCLSRVSLNLKSCNNITNIGKKYW